MVGEIMGIQNIKVLETEAEALEFFVAGTGRSGTVYTSQLFTALGVNCSHEYVFNAGDPRYNGMLSQGGRLYGDASWMTVPFIGNSNYSDKKIIHIVRDPLLVVQSLLGSNFITEETGDFTPWFRDIIIPNITSIKDQQDILKLAVDYVWMWNRFIFNFSSITKYMVKRLEDLNDFETVYDIFTFLKKPISGDKFFNTLSTKNLYMNSKSRNNTIDWDMILSKPNGPKLYSLAERFNYV